MRLILGKTEIDFSVMSNQDLVYNNGIEIPVQDLLEVAQNHGPNCSLFTMVDVDITTPDRKLERSYELAEEQVFFAQNLIDKIISIITHYPNTGGAKNLKADILTAIDDSMFER
jgi:hypothetical protein